MAAIGSRCLGAQGVWRASRNLTCCLHIPSVSIFCPVAVAFTACFPVKITGYVFLETGPCASGYGVAERGLPAGKNGPENQGYIGTKTMSSSRLAADYSLGLFFKRGQGRVLQSPSVAVIERQAHREGVGDPDSAQRDDDGRRC